MLTEGVARAPARVLAEVVGREVRGLPEEGAELFFFLVSLLVLLVDRGWTRKGRGRGRGRGGAYERADLIGGVAFDGGGEGHVDVE